MESGTPGVKSTPDGWLSRAAGALPSGPPSPFRSVALAPGCPAPARRRGGAGDALAGPVRRPRRAAGGGGRAPTLASRISNASLALPRRSGGEAVGEEARVQWADLEGQPPAVALRGKADLAQVTREVCL